MYKNKECIILGFAIPEVEMKKVLGIDRFPAIQTHKFIWNFIKGLESNCKNTNFHYVSSRPVSEYPSYLYKIIKYKKWIMDERIIYEIPFVNKGVLKLLSRFLSSFYFINKIYFKIKNKSEVTLIIYSVHVPFLLTGYLISKLFKVTLVGVWTDPPSVISKNENFLKKKMRLLELKISKILMKKFDKAIVLTKFLATDFMEKKSYLVIEGIANIQETKKILKKTKKNDEFKVLYTGSLEERYGIKEIVKGVLKTNNKKIILEICGKGDYEEEIKKFSYENSRIKYLGFLKNEEALKKQSEADLLINARSAQDEYVKYSFPSKMMEYMNSGTPLLTTLLPGIPEEYYSKIISLENNTPLEIAKKLDLVSIMPKDQLRKIGLEAKEFIKTKDYIKQGKQIKKFLNLE